MKTIRFILFCFLVLSFFCSCKNFLNGNDFLIELDEVIADVNAPQVQIFISADADTGTVTPSGNVDCKVGRTFPVIFKESKGYQFLYWEVINKDTKQPLKDVLTIDKENEVEKR